LELDFGTAVVVATLLLAVVSALFGAKYKQAKCKASQVRGLLDSVIEAAEDDEVSEREFEKVVASAKRLISAEA
jgi:hypothetical protein